MAVMLIDLGVSFLDSSPGDIMMAIDGTPISEEGDVCFRNHERVPYEHLVTSRTLGDVINVSVLRSTHAPSKPSEKFDMNKLAVRAMLL